MLWNRHRPILRPGRILKNLINLTKYNLIFLSGMILGSGIGSVVSYFILTGIGSNTIQNCSFVC